MQAFAIVLRLLFERHAALYGMHPSKHFINKEIRLAYLELHCFIRSKHQTNHVLHTRNTCNVIALNSICVIYFV